MNIEDYNKYYIQGSDHYLIPKDEFKELFNEMINWKEESQRQKEVIDKAIEYIKENVYEENNGCGYYWWEITNKDELLEILKGDSNE